MKKANGIEGKLAILNLLRHFNRRVLTFLRASSISTPSSQRRESQQSSSRNKSHACPTSLSARYNKDLKAEKRKSPKKDHAPKGYISLTDSDEAGKTALPVREPTNQPISLDEDDDIEVISGSVRRRGSPPVDEDDLQLSEEEFPELIAAAKERERQRLLQKEKAARSFSERNHGSKRDDLDDIFDSGVETPVEDPVVEILITSKMEGTSQLRVKRKFSQPFKPVRLSWCDKQMTTDGQPFEQALKDEIFLTWKSHKLYDNTTCESLGLTVDSSGKLSGDGIDQHGRLHIEAWTADALEYYKKRKAAKEKKEQGGSDEEAAAREARKEAIPKTKLILKAKDMEDVKLTVKAATTVEKMIGGFRSIRELPEDKHITIHMDGDELGLSTTVGELELEDMDILDVHVR